MTMTEETGASSASGIELVAQLQASGARGRVCRVWSRRARRHPEDRLTPARELAASATRDCNERPCTGRYTTPCPAKCRAQPYSALEGRILNIQEILSRPNDFLQNGPKIPESQDFVPESQLSPCAAPTTPAPYRRSASSGAGAPR